MKLLSLTLVNEKTGEEKTVYVNSDDALAYIGIYNGADMVRKVMEWTSYGDTKGIKTSLKTFVKHLSRDADNAECDVNALLHACNSGDKVVVKWLLKNRIPRIYDAVTHALNKSIINSINGRHDDIFDLLLDCMPDLEHQFDILLTAVNVNNGYVIEKLAAHTGRMSDEEVGAIMVAASTRCDNDSRKELVNIIDVNRVPTSIICHPTVMESTVLFAFLLDNCCYKTVLDDAIIVAAKYFLRPQLCALSDKRSGTVE